MRLGLQIYVKKKKKKVVAEAGWRTIATLGSHLWEFLQELQVAMNSLAFGGRVLPEESPTMPSSSLLPGGDKPWLERL